MCPQLTEQQNISDNNPIQTKPVTHQVQNDDMQWNHPSCSSGANVEFLSHLDVFDSTADQPAGLEWIPGHIEDLQRAKADNFISTVFSCTAPQRKPRWKIKVMMLLVVSFSYKNRSKQSQWMNVRSYSVWVSGCRGEDSSSPPIPNT